MYRASTKRAAKGRLRQPYRQGDLDGLCGVYSAVNAVRALCPEVDHDTAGCLFETMLLALPKVDTDATTTVSWGVGHRAEGASPTRRQLEHLLKKATGHVGDELDIKLTVARLPDRLRHTRNLDALWGWLARRVSPSCRRRVSDTTCVAVLGLGGRHSHWTVAVQVTPSQIRLFDSSRMGVLHRKRCTLGKAVNRSTILPVHVFLIARRDVV